MDADSDQRLRANAVRADESPFICLRRSILSRLWVMSRSDKKLIGLLASVGSYGCSSRALSRSVSSPALLERVRSRSVFRELAASRIVVSIASGNDREAL